MANARGCSSNGCQSLLRLPPLVVLVQVLVVTLGALLPAAQTEYEQNDSDTLYYTFCPRVLAESLGSCVTGNSNQTSEVTLKNSIIGGWYQCWSSLEGGATSSNDTAPVLRVLLPDIYEDWLRPTLTHFSALHGVLMQLDVQPMSRLLDTIVNDAYLPPSRQHAVWLQTTLTTQHLADFGLSLDLSYLVDSPNSGVQWSDIYQLFRLQLASYRGRVVSMPLDGSTMYLINRKDVFERLGLEVPRTWQGVLDYAAAYTRAREAALVEAEAQAAGAANSTGPATQLPPYPLCVPLGASCRRLTLLQAIWSTIAQTHGSQQGVHFDPATLEPQLDTPAAAEAFRIMAGLLAAAAPPEPDEQCTHGSLGLARGQCALVLAVYVPQMRLFILPEFKPTVNMSQLSVSPVPGSHVVWTHGSGEDGLQPCTLDRCPLASSYVLGGDTEPTLVNHAPLSPGSNLAGAINRGMPLVVQYLSFELLAFLGSLDRYNADEPARLLQTVAPVREHFVATDTVSKWVEAGYDHDVMAAAMPPIAFTRQHPNRAWDLRMPYHMYYNDVLANILSGLGDGTVVLDEQLLQQANANNNSNGEGNGEGTGTAARPATAGAGRRSLQGTAAVQGRPRVSGHFRRQLVDASQSDSLGLVSTTGSDSPAQSQSRLASPSPSSPQPPMRLSSALADGQHALAAFYTPDVYLEKYLASLAITATPAADGAGDSGALPHEGHSVGVETLVPAVVVSALALAALGAGGWVLWRRSRRRRAREGHAWDWKLRHREGAVARPVALLVTDIQDSTALWEALPAAVMSEAVRLHHTCVRKLLLTYRGYESATEGDSFILAFHTVKQAVTFALDLQAQLLVQPWPRELLEQPSCSVVSVDLPEGFPFTPRSGLTERGNRYSGAPSGHSRGRSSKTLNVASAAVVDSSAGGGGGKSRPNSSARPHLLLTSGSGNVRALDAPAGTGLASAGLPRWLRALTIAGRSEHSGGARMCGVVAAPVELRASSQTTGISVSSLARVRTACHSAQGSAAGRLVPPPMPADAASLAADGGADGGGGKAARAGSFSYLSTDMALQQRSCRAASLGTIMAGRPHYLRGPDVTGLGTQGDVGSTRSARSGRGGRGGSGGRGGGATTGDGGGGGGGTATDSGMADGPETTKTHEVSGGDSVGGGGGGGGTAGSGGQSVPQSRAPLAWLSMLNADGGVSDDGAGAGGDLVGRMRSIGGDAVRRMTSSCKARQRSSFSSIGGGDGGGANLLLQPGSRLAAAPEVVDMDEQDEQDGALVLDGSTSTALDTPCGPRPPSMYPMVGQASGSGAGAGVHAVWPSPHDGVVVATGTHSPTAPLRVVRNDSSSQQLPGKRAASESASLSCLPLASAVAAAAAAPPLPPPPPAPPLRPPQSAGASCQVVQGGLFKRVGRGSFLFRSCSPEPAAAADSLQGLTPSCMRPPTPPTPVSALPHRGASDAEPVTAGSSSPPAPPDADLQRYEQQAAAARPQSLRSASLAPPSRKQVLLPAAASPLSPPSVPTTGKPPAWRILDALPAAAQLLSSMTNTADGEIANVDVGADADTVDATLDLGTDGDSRVRGFDHVLAGGFSGYGRSNRATVAFAGLADRDDDEPDAISGRGTRARALLSSRSSHRRGLSPMEPSQTLGQLMRKAAAAAAAAANIAVAAAAVTPATSATPAATAMAALRTQAASAGLSSAVPRVSSPGMVVAPSGASLAVTLAASGASLKASAAAAAGLIFRGLRVRVGISWALPSASELQYNAAAARMVYGGPCVAACKAVADLAHGGQVVMSGAAKERLDVECGPGGSGRPSGTLMLHLAMYSQPRPNSGGQRSSSRMSCEALDRGRAAAAAVYAGAGGSPVPTAEALAAAYASNASVLAAAYASTTSTAALASGGIGGSLPVAFTVRTSAGGALDVTGGGGGSGTAAAAACTSPQSTALQPIGSGLLATVNRVTSIWSSPGVGGGVTRASAPPPPPQPPPLTTSSTTEMRSVYWVTSPNLSPRLAVLPSLRLPADATRVRDVYSAPVGRVSYVVVQIPAVGMLMAWNQAVTEAALRVLQDAAAAQLQRVSSYGTGYKAPCATGADRGQICTVFTTAAAAVHWAEGLRRELLEASWPSELLTHELCEVVEAVSSLMYSELRCGRATSTRRTRRSSVNSCLFPEDPDPAATAAAAVNTASGGGGGGGGGGGVASVSGTLAESPGALPSLSSPQQRLSLNATATGGTGRGGGGGGDGDSFYNGSGVGSGGTCRRAAGGAGGVQLRAASGGNLAAFLMMRRQECRSRRALNQTGPRGLTGPAAAAAGVAATQTYGGGGAVAEICDAAESECGGDESEGLRIRAALAGCGPGGAGERVRQCSAGGAGRRAPSIDCQVGAALPASRRGGYGTSSCSQLGLLPYDGVATPAAACPPSPFESSVAVAAVASGFGGDPPQVRRPNTDHGIALAAPRAPQVASATTARTPPLDIPGSGRVPRVSVALSRGESPSGSPRPYPSPAATAATAAAAAAAAAAAEAAAAAAAVAGAAAAAVPASVPLSPTAEADGSQHLGRGAVQSAPEETGSGGSASGPIVLLRGLRIRAGIATGTADWGIQDQTHDLFYSGRPVATATKLAAAAACGQVLCDEPTRNEATAEQLWALTLEEEATEVAEAKQEDEVPGLQRRAEGDGGIQSEAAGQVPAAPPPATGTATAAAATARRQQLLAFMRADSSGLGIRKRGLSRAYVCRMFDRSARSGAAVLLGARVTDPAEGAAATAPLPELGAPPPSMPMPAPLFAFASARRAARARRASTIDGSAAATMATAAAAAAAEVAVAAEAANAAAGPAAAVTPRTTGEGSCQRIEGVFNAPKSYNGLRSTGRPAAGTGSGGGASGALAGSRSAYRLSLEVRNGVAGGAAGRAPGAVASWLRARQ